jgi:general secretion pathway protein A
MTKQTSKPQSAMQFFGLKYPPFADTFAVHDPFQSDAEKIIVQKILALIRQGKNLAIYGEAGTGKSMLTKTIINQLDTKEFRIAIIPYGGLNPPVLLRELCDEFGIDTAGRKSHLARMAQNFKSDKEKPFPVIIIDEAHEMQKQSFFDLCSLLHDATTRVTTAALILVGQPSLRKMLELDIFTPVRTRLTSLYSMPKLTIEESEKFLQYRLLIAKANSKIFSDDAITNIAVDAKGNRRILMNIAAVCLEEAARRNDKVVTAEIVAEIAQDNL